MTEEEKVAEKQKPEYRVFEEYRPEGAQNLLNEAAEQGYEVVAITPIGDDDMGRNWVFFTVRLRRELQPPAKAPLLTSVVASMVEWQERVEELSKLVEELSKLTHSLLSYHQTALDEMSRRLDLLEAWRRDSLRPDLHRFADASGANEE